MNPGERGETRYVITEASFFQVNVRMDQGRLLMNNKADVPVSLLFYSSQPTPLIMATNQTQRTVPQTMQQATANRPVRPPIPTTTPTARPSTANPVVRAPIQVQPPRPPTQPVPRARTRSPASGTTGGRSIAVPGPGAPVPGAQPQPQRAVSSSTSPGSSSSSSLSSSAAMQGTTQAARPGYRAHHHHPSTTPATTVSSTSSPGMGNGRPAQPTAATTDTKPRIPGGSLPSRAALAQDGPLRTASPPLASVSVGESVGTSSTAQAKVPAFLNKLFRCVFPLVLRFSRG